MLTDFFEPFQRLKRTLAPDGLGGATERWEEGETFRGGVTFVPGGEVSVAGLSALRALPVLVHEPGLTLSLNDRVRRLSDGEVFRVAGDSGDMRTPGIAAVQLAQVTIEVIAPAMTRAAGACVEGSP